MKKFILVLLITMLFSPLVIAQNDDKGFIYTPPGSVVSPEKNPTMIMSDISTWLTSFITTVSVIFIIVGAIQYALALGDQEKIKTAKRTLTWAVLGIVLALLSYVIVPQIAELFQ